MLQKHTISGFLWLIMPGATSVSLTIMSPVWVWAGAMLKEVLVPFVPTQAPDMGLQSCRPELRGQGRFHVTGQAKARGTSKSGAGRWGYLQRATRE